MVAQQAEQTLTVVIKNIIVNTPKLESIIDQVAAIEVNIDSISFEQTDKSVSMKEARKAAFESAK